MPFDTTNVVEAGETPIYITDFDIITWSVRVEVSGEIDGTYVGGAANLAWNLTLKGPDGQPVGTGETPFGLGSPLTPGFFSSIMNVDTGGAFATQPACFTWEFGDSAPYGRLIDRQVENGANMSDFSYPSAYRYYRLPGAAAPVDPATVDTPTGTLMGMRAGYVNLDWEDGGERTGVGILNDGGGLYSCYLDIGAKAPIAEGQINMAGLPKGMYTLELTPGDGNRVIYPNGFECWMGTTGSFAMPAGTVVGSTIQFQTPFVDCYGWLTVNLAPAEAVAAGCTWSVYGAPALASGQTVELFGPCRYLVSFQAAPGWVAPPDVWVDLQGPDTAKGPDADTTFVRSVVGACG